MVLSYTVHTDSFTAHNNIFTYNKYIFAHKHDTPYMFVFLGVNMFLALLRTHFRPKMSLSLAKNIFMVEVCDLHIEII